MNLDPCEREINIALVLTFWTVECGAVRLDDPPYLSFTTRFSAFLALPSIYAKMMWEVSQGVISINTSEVLESGSPASIASVITACVL